jgi:hypothetical protein
MSPRSYAIVNVQYLEHFLNIVEEYDPYARRAACRAVDRDIVCYRLVYQEKKASV